MTTTVTLTDTQTQSVIDADQAAAAQIANAAKATISAGQFVYLAAFDGTNNNYKDVRLSGNPNPTNVGTLWKDEIEPLISPTSNVGGQYYPGPGTGGALDLSAGPAQSFVTDSAEAAYTDFCDQAGKWLSQPGNKGKTVSVDFAAFSRGCASAAMLTQLLFEQPQEPQGSE
jgi:hypothetical protein